MPTSPQANPIDINTQGLIGKDVDRVDGPLKVTGHATYAYEYVPEGQPAAYGFIVGAAIPKGSIHALNMQDAKAAPGVLLVMDYTNTPKQKDYGSPHSDDALARAKPFLDSPDVRYYGEPVALVVAENFEQARYAASLVKVQYAAAPTAKGSVNGSMDEAYKPAGMNGGIKTDTSMGDFDKAFKEAPVKIDATYTTPYQMHNAIEPHASMAVWAGDKLTLYCAHQLPMSARKSVAKTLEISEDNIRIICKYIGGGFGGKLPTQAEIVLSALAARKINRPVKVALTRQQEFVNSTHRGESIQRIRLGATEDGKLTAIAHENWLQTATFDEFAEQAAGCTRSLYAAPNRLTAHRLVKLDLPPSGSMRAPGEAMGLLAVEQAMDELAEKLKMDPIELRLRNDTQEDPEKKIPFSSRSLAACMKEGAEKFGWNKRSATPAQTRDGRWLVGYGMSAAIRPNFMQKSKARVTLDEHGKLIAELAMTDPGTGTYTVLTQIAAETMQMPLGDVRIIMGDSNLPETPGSGGSWGANSAGSGLYNTCMALREEIAKAAIKQKDSPLYGAKAADATFTNSHIAIGNKQDSFKAVALRTDKKSIKAEGEIEKPKTYSTYSQAAFGAHFVEVGVDESSGEIRLRRMLGVFAAGRILNKKTARSQAIGGMIWGVSSALHEDAVVDPHHTYFVNHDMAEYHVPVHADVPNVDAYYLQETDDKTGPLSIKGVGELGICGSGAAVANAVYNACGVRIREYPLTLDKVLAKWV